MKKLELLSLSTVLPLAALLGACGGEEQVASRYVATLDVTPEAGGTLFVAPSLETDLGGTQLDVPAGAVSDAVTITVEPANDLTFDGDDVAGGPAANFGPDGTQFAIPATMTLPIYQGPTADEEIFVVARDADDTQRLIDASLVTLNTADGTVTFPVQHFTTFQPGRGQRAAAQCQTNADCAANETCQQGACVTTPSSGCRTDSDCSSGDWCVQGACTTPAPGACRTNMDCASTGGANLVCQNGMCTPQSTGCMTDADCPRGDWCVNASCMTPRQGQCRTAADCPSGQACVNSVCQQSSPCALTVTPSALNFGSAAVGTTTARSVTVSATQQTSIVQLSVSGSSEFATPQVSGQLPLTVLPNRPTTIVVDFTPSSAGGKQATLNIQEAQAICPAVTVSLSGVGTTTSSGQRCQSNADCPPGEQCVRNICM